jgi:hypothetical protein
MVNGTFLHYMWDSATDFGNLWPSLSGIHTINFSSGDPSMDTYVKEFVKDNQLECLPVFKWTSICARHKEGIFLYGEEYRERE